MTSRVYVLEELVIEDDAAFRAVPMYLALKDVVVQQRHRFYVLDGSREDHARLLNLTLWSGATDVLASRRVPADVVTHIAWHRLARRALGAANDSAEAMFLGEAIASAFDLYLVGRLLAQPKTPKFLSTQVPAMADAALAAGVKRGRFEAMLWDIAHDPEAAFEELRQLLFDTTRALYRSRTLPRALAALIARDEHRFAGLLHHYAIGDWVLYARAHGKAGEDVEARRADAALRKKKGGLSWLGENWVRK